MHALWRHMSQDSLPYPGGAPRHQVSALRPPPGVPLHTHENPLVSPVHSRRSMIRYIARVPSSSRVAAVSTVPVQPAAAQVCIMRDPRTRINIVAVASLTAVQNALPRKVAIAIASHLVSISSLASDRPPPRPTHMTDPVHRPSRQLQERSPVHDPLHSTKEHASPRPPALDRGPSMLCNDP